MVGPPTRHGGATRRRFKRQAYGRHLMLTGIVFVLPAFLFFLVFRIYPMVVAVWVSLHRYDLLTPKRFVGLGNYAGLLRDQLFLNSIKLTAYYVLGTSLPMVAAATLLALALSNERLAARGAFMTIVFVPVTMSTVVASIVWKLMYNYAGPINSLLAGLSVQPVDWLNRPGLAMPAIIFMSVWKEVGYYTIILAAGLHVISRDLYEAAWLDGAGRWATFWRITWPLLAPAMAYVCVIVLIQSMRAFASFLIMTEGGPGDATRVLALLVYQTAFLFLKMGRASAMSLVMLAILMVLTLIQLKFFERRDLA